MPKMEEKVLRDTYLSYLSYCISILNVFTISSPTLFI